MLRILTRTIIILEKRLDPAADVNFHRLNTP